MSANVDAMVREGIRAYRAGNKAEARTLLMKAVELDEYNEQAWLWLSATVETPEEQRTCLENVLVINPNNERARNGIQMLSAKSGSTPPAAPSAPASPFGSLPTSAVGAAPADDELPTSLEWDMASPETSSPSSNFRPVNEPTKQDYDDWVSSLNLGAQPASAPDLGGITSFTMTPFTDDENLFGVEDEEPVLPPAPARASAPVAPPPPPRPAPPVSAPQMPMVMSPAPDDDTDDLLDDIEGTDLDEEFGDDFDMGGDDQDPNEYFRLIPGEIKATRLPGEDEKYPAFVPIGLVVLIVLNLAAAGLLVMNLLS
ncbi:MAG: hypothetical protein U0694_24820 [Anaerolineae bacterium]